MANGKLWPITVANHDYSNHFHHHWDYGHRFLLGLGELGTFQSIGSASLCCQAQQRVGPYFWPHLRSCGLDALGIQHVYVLFVWSSHGVGDDQSRDIGPNQSLFSTLESPNG